MSQRSSCLRSWPSLCALALLAACDDPQPTAIVVEVTTDLAVPEVAKLFRVRVLGPDQVMVHERLMSGTELPGRLELVPEDPGRGSVLTVEATALLGAAQFSRSATVSFRRGSILLLRLPLLAECACHSCPAGETCEAGPRCVPMLRDTLPSYSPRAQPPLDSSTVEMVACPADGSVEATDAISPDAGPVGGPDADDGSPLDAAHDSPSIDHAAEDAEPSRPDAPADAAAPDSPLETSPDVAMNALTDVAPAAADVAAPMPDAPTPRPQGAACTSNDQCASRACVDAVCCNSACNLPCTGCSRLKTGASDGTCSPALAGTDPRGDCTADAPASCGYDGFCNGAGACRLYGSTTLCGPPSCSGTSHAPARFCTGAGACSPPAPSNCGLYLCTQDGCPQSCQSHAGCAATAFCSGGTCVPQRPGLAACTEDRQCRSNSCSLGVCL